MQATRAVSVSREVASREGRLTQWEEEEEEGEEEEGGEEEEEEEEEETRAGRAVSLQGSLSTVRVTVVAVRREALGAAAAATVAAVAVNALAA